MRSLFLIPALTFALTACTSFVPSTLAQLSRLDPFTANPDDMAVALMLPTGLDLRPGTTVMTFTAVHSPSGETFQRDYTLQEDRTTEDGLIYTLSPEDVANLNALKVTLEPLKETSDGNSTLSMGISSEACRIAGAMIEADPRMNVLLRLEADGPLRPFLRDAPLLEYFEIEQLTELPQCNGPM